MFGLRDDPMMQLALLGSPLPGEGAVILGDQRLVVGGQVVVNYLDPYGCAPEVTDRTPRTHAPQNITIHTTTGQPHDPVLVPDPATETRVCELARDPTPSPYAPYWRWLQGQPVLYFAHAHDAETSAARALYDARDQGRVPRALVGTIEWTPEGRTSRTNVVLELDEYGRVTRDDVSAFKTNPYLAERLEHVR